MDLKRAVITVIFTVGMVPVISHAEGNSGPIRSWFQSFQKNIQDLFEQLKAGPVGGKPQANASSGPIFSTHTSGDSLNLHYNKQAAKSTGKQIESGFKEVGKGIANVF